MKMSPLAVGVVRGFSRLHTQIFRWIGPMGPGAFPPVALAWAIFFLLR